MKQLNLILAFLLLPFLCVSQGITFEQGTWSEVLAKAKKTNKPVFVDVRTSESGACKQMSSVVYPLKSVGDAYNAQFVCYQIDAEKGEGVEIAKQYDVETYPTFLFVMADGTLFSRDRGYMDAESLVKLSKDALMDMDERKQLFVWEAEFEKKKNSWKTLEQKTKDSVFILEYLNKRSSLGLSVSDQFDTYLEILPRPSERLVNLYKREGDQMKVWTYAFYLLVQDRDTYLSMGFNTIDKYIRKAFQTSIDEAVKYKDEEKLNRIISEIDKLNFTFDLKKEKVYMEYYQRTKEPEKYLKYATLYCNNYLMKVDPATFSAKNNSKEQLFDRLNELKIPYFLIDSETVPIEKLQEMVERNERVAACEELNNTAWKVFQTVDEVAVLKDALRWSDRSLQLDTRNANYMDTNANILYKLGRKKEAIDMEKRAVSHDTSLRFEAKVEKMEAGEKLW